MKEEEEISKNGIKILLETYEQLKDKNKDEI